MKRITIILLLLTVIFLGGCSLTDDETSNTTLESTNTQTTDITTHQVSYFAFSENYQLSHNNYLDVDEDIAYLDAGFYHTILLTTKGRVFTWGFNQYGQLGNETLEDSHIPNEITSFFNLSEGEHITQVSIGALHSAALSSNYRLFIWGNNDHNQLGDGTYGPSSNETVPKDITSEFNLESNEYIERIDLGLFHSSALTSSGRLFMWGNNEKGQIGNETTTKQPLPLDITSFFDFSTNEQIQQVELSNTNSAILTTENQLYIWGDNAYGQIGNDSFIDSSTPINITPYFELSDNETIEKISLGVVHSSALTNKGNIFTWGFNGEGLLGNQSTENYPKPTNITSYVNLEADEFITDIEMGGNHSSLLTSSNNIFIWGQNEYGELGINSNDSIDTPHLITDIFSLAQDDSIKTISLGTINSFVVTTQGKIFGWGYNRYGGLGMNSNLNAYIPKLVYLSKIELIDSMSINNNSQLTIYTPEKELYSITQWYMDKNLLNEFNSNININNDLFLYGQWNKIED